jgi:hypothetical protein
MHNLTNLSERDHQEHLTDKIITSTEQVGQKIVASTNAVATRLTDSDKARAVTLETHYSQQDKANEARFKRQRRWAYTSIGCTVLILVVLAGFAFAFFNYAIIVTTH